MNAPMTAMTARPATISMVAAIFMDERPGATRIGPCRERGVNADCSALRPAADQGAVGPGVDADFGTRFVLSKAFSGCSCKYRIRPL